MTPYDTFKPFIRSYQWYGCPKHWCNEIRDRNLINRAYRKKDRRQMKEYILFALQHEKTWYN